MNDKKGKDNRYLFAIIGISALVVLVVIILIVVLTGRKTKEPDSGSGGSGQNTSEDRSSTRTTEGNTWFVTPGTTGTTEGTETTEATDATDATDDTETTESTEEDTATEEPTKEKAYRIGDVVQYGTFEQDDNTTNGAENIEWVVLDKHGDEYLLISKYILDCHYYAEYREAGSEGWRSWDNSWVRLWLNEIFYESAFSGEEKARIVKGRVTMEKNHGYEYAPNDIYYGRETSDRVFLLSLNEAKELFPTDESRVAQPTAYAKAQYSRNQVNMGWDDGSADCWWLRSPSNYADGCASLVGESGIILDSAKSAGSKNAWNGVRPVIRINLDESVTLTHEYSKELSDYWNDNIFNFVAEHDHFYDVEATSGIEFKYYNTQVIVGSDFDEKISFLSLDAGTDYTLYGMTPGMKMKDAQAKILAQGGTQEDSNEYTFTYRMKDGYTLTFWYSGDVITTVSAGRDL